MPQLGLHSHNLHWSPDGTMEMTGGNGDVGGGAHHAAEELM